MGKRVIKQIKDWTQGMTPLPNAEGIYKIQHFNTLNNQLVPYRGLVAYLNDDPGIAMDRMYKIVRAINVTGATTSELFCLYNVYGDTKYGIMKWDISAQSWRRFKNSAATAAYEKILHYYNGKFYGLKLGTHIWSIDNSGVNETAAALTYLHSEADPITHSKDGLMYIAVDNKIYKFDGTTATLGQTLPSTFTITSITEKGDYIDIVGYDNSVNRSTEYLWDRDISLATLTSKSDLGPVRASHIANLGGISWIVSTSFGDSISTSFDDQEKLVIGYIGSNGYKVFKKYKFTNFDIQAKYVEENNLYFAATYAFKDDVTTHQAIFRLDETGRLFIEHELSKNTTKATVYGIIKDGDGWFFGTDTSIGYHSSENYDADATVETNMYEPDNISMNYDTVGVCATFDPLPVGASVNIKTRADNETDWTDIVTFDTDGSVKESFPIDDLDTASLRQFKITSSGGAVINSFQADFEEKNDEEYN